MKKIKLTTVLLTFSTAAAHAETAIVPIEVTYNLTPQSLTVIPVSGGGNRNRVISAVANGQALLLYTPDSSRINCPQIRDGVVPLIKDGWRRIASISDIQASGVSVTQLRNARCVIVLPKLN